MRFTPIFLFFNCFLFFSINADPSSIDMDVERQRVIDFFHHGYSNYMENAFPLDELRPLSCTGYNTLGNYSLTLIDTLDMLPILGEMEEFEKQVMWIQNNLNFNLDVNVSTFETNIRVVGGLLSSHLFAEEFLVKKNFFPIIFNKIN